MATSSVEPAGTVTVTRAPSPPHAMSPGAATADNRPARQRGEGAREQLRVVGRGETDAAFAPVHRQQRPHAGTVRGAVDGVNGGGVLADHGPSVRRPVGLTPHPWDIVAKNSTLFFVRLRRSRRNSIASTGGISARKLRSR